MKKQGPAIKKSLVFQTKRCPMAPMASHDHSKKERAQKFGSGGGPKTSVRFFLTSFVSVRSCKIVNRVSRVQKCEPTCICMYIHVCTCIYMYIHVLIRLISIKYQ